MKNRIKKPILLLLLLTVSIGFAACSDNWEAPYASLDQQGSTISVRFDANGGLFAGTNDVCIVDAYNPAEGIANSDGTVSFPLLSPDNALRREGCFSVSKNGYFLAGWYTEKEARVDKNGDALDDYGVLCSESGRPQGWTYSNLWNFNTDLLTIDPESANTSGTPVLTLYAAWIPYIQYEFYAVNPDSGENIYLDTVQAIDLEVPQWSMKTGKLDLNEFPARDGFTFDAAYLDNDMTTPLTDTIHGSDQYVNYETGTLNVESVPVYTTWLEGTWFKIYTAEQFFNNSRLDGNYLICNDIDFSNFVWSPTLVKGKFTGKIFGNGYTFANINVIQGDNAQVYGGLFGTLESGAVISELKLENISVTIEAGSRLQGATYGLLAGSISSDAILYDVTVNGTLYISEKCYPQSDYTIGLLCGSGNADGVTWYIDCLLAEETSEKISITIEDDGSVTVTFLT